MNRFFTGLPRAGKTKAAVAVAFDAILGGRKVAALLAFKVNEWTDGADAVHRGLLRRLQMRGYRGELSEDLRLLTDDEAREFWRYRWDRRERAWGVMPCGDEHFEFDAANYAGCLYILDEVHRLFPSQSSSGLLREYLSQSGRCGDDVIAISQVPVMAHKSLRDLAHEEVFAVNHALRRAWFFREPDIIVCHVYSRCPHLDTDQRQYAFTLRGRREELEDCYDTSGGGAMLGQTAADIGARAGGLHLGWLAAVLLVVFLGIWAASSGCQRALRWGMDRGSAKLHSVVGRVSSNAVPRVVSVRGSGGGLPFAFDHRGMVSGLTGSLLVPVPGVVTNNPRYWDDRRIISWLWSPGRQGVAVTEDGEEIVFDTFDERGSTLLLDGHAWRYGQRASNRVPRSVAVPVSLEHPASVPVVPRMRGTK